MSQTVGVTESVPSTAKFDAISRLTDQLVAGLIYHREVRTPSAGVGPAWNWMYAFNKRGTDRYFCNDDDGNYGNSHIGHGAALRYLRLHDADSAKVLGYAADYLLSLEAAAVAQNGPAWSGSFSYWAAPYAFTQTANPGFPDFNHVYAAGDPRLLTSIDQTHMGSHFLYSYLYLLKDEAAGTPRRAEMLSFLDRAVAREAVNFGTTSPNNLILGNLQRRVTGGASGTALNNGMTDTLYNGASGGVLATPHYGFTYGPWKVVGIDGAISNASSNGTIDDHFRALFAPNTTALGLTRYMQGQANDMLTLDFGRQNMTYDTTALAATLGTPGGVYPVGWEGWAATPGNLFRYAAKTTPPDALLLGSRGNRDTLSGRAPQRAIVVALAALRDPTYDVRVNESVPTTVNVVTALEDILHTTALYLLDPDTGLLRQSYPGYLGKSGAYTPDTNEPTFAGYALMAAELYLLVKAIQSGTRTNPYTLTAAAPAAPAAAVSANNVPPVQAPTLTAVNGGIIARFYPNAGVTAQTVTVTPAGGAAVNVPVAATDTSVTINGLTAATVYTVTYSATNSTGTGVVGSATATIPAAGTGAVVPAPSGTAGALRNHIFAPTPPSDVVSHQLRNNATVLIPTGAPTGPINYMHTGLTANSGYNYYYDQTNASGVTTQSAALTLVPGNAQAGTYGMWLQYGQSLSQGFNSGGGLSTTVHPRNRMFSGTIVGGQGAQLLTTVQAREYSSETGMVAGGTLYATLTDALLGGGQHHDLLLGTFGIGGAPIGGLKKGGVSPYYQRLLDGVQAGKNDAVDGGYTYSGVPLITWVHGESAEANLEATYRADVEQLRVDLVADIKAITGQTNDPKFVVSQTSSHTYYGHAAPYAAIEQYKSFKAAPNVMLMSGAKYHLPYSADGLHLSNIGDRMMGEQFGLIAYRILELGQNWRPLYPTAVTGAGTATITATFNVPTGVLALDTTLVTDPGNYGFEVAYVDGTAAPAISSAALNGTGNQVVVTLASALTKVAYLRYAYTGVRGAKSGPVTGARGNLRDSDPTVGTSGPLYNWCVHFQETVT